jgi:hypothetical protein
MFNHYLESLNLNTRFTHYFKLLYLATKFRHYFKLLSLTTTFKLLCLSIILNQKNLVINFSQYV